MMVIIICYKYGEKDFVLAATREKDARTNGRLELTQFLYFSSRSKSSIHSAAANYC